MPHACRVLHIFRKLSFSSSSLLTFQERLQRADLADQVVELGVEPGLGRRVPGALAEPLGLGANLPHSGADRVHLGRDVDEVAGREVGLGLDLGDEVGAEGEGGGDGAVLHPGQAVEELLVLGRRGAVRDVIGEGDVCGVERKTSTRAGPEPFPFLPVR